MCEKIVMEMQPGRFAKVEKIGVELVDHPPYPSDLAPSDCYLLPKLTTHWIVA